MNRSIQITAALLIALALSACAAAPAAQAPTSPPPTAAPTATPMITDALGRQVAIPAPVKRIVSIAPSITEALFAIGAGPQVVGDTKYCNYPPEADALPKIGGFTPDTISVESIVALSPDLVIGGSKVQAPVAEALAKLKIPALIFDPKTFEEVYSNIEQLGALTGRADAAGAVVANMRARVAAVQQRVAKIPTDKRPTIFYEVFDAPLMTAGPSTFIGQMIGLAGATSIFADTSEEYPQVSAEAIVTRDPAVIVGPSSHGDKLTPAQVAARPGWEKIRAVRDGRIYLLNEDIVSRPGPRLADALEALADALYAGQK
jgi:iron complex transport system substrate-binding protein